MKCVKLRDISSCRLFSFSIDVSIIWGWGMGCSSVHFHTVLCFHFIKFILHSQINLKMINDNIITVAYLLKIHWTTYPMLNNPIKSLRRLLTVLTLEELWTSCSISLMTMGLGLVHSTGLSLPSKYRICCKVHCQALHNCSGLSQTLKKQYHHFLPPDQSLSFVLILLYQVPVLHHPARRTVDLPLLFFLCQEFQEYCLCSVLLSENTEIAESPLVVQEQNLQTDFEYIILMAILLILLYWLYT